MNARDGDALRGAFPMPSRVVLWIIAFNVTVYVIELVLLRAGSALPALLILTPAEVVGHFRVWQLVTAPVLHDPSSAMHLLLNMLMLWLFAPAVEAMWGSRRLLWAYVGCGIAGSVFTVALGMLSFVPGIGSFFAPIYNSQHLGASGSVLGLLVAWGVVHYHQTMNFLFLGAMRGRTFLALTLAIEVLVALSFSGVSSTSHFGGMAAGAVAALEPWRSGALEGMLRRARLRRQKRAIEKKLARFEVIEGGRKDEPKKAPPKKDDWVH